MRQRAITSIWCCGMSVLLTSFFLQFKYCPPYKIYEGTDSLFLLVLKEPLKDRQSETREANYLREQEKMGEYLRIFSSYFPECSVLILKKGKRTPYHASLNLRPAIARR